MQIKSCLSYLLSAFLLTSTASIANATTALEERVRTIQAETEALRGITADSPIEPKILDSAALTATLEKAIAEELEKPEIRYAYEFYKLINLINEDTDIALMYQRLLEGQVGGLYDPKGKNLYVVEAFDINSFLGGVILSHEITHALQDKAYDLDSFLHGEKILDRQQAKMAVVEGDATILMMEWGAERFTLAVLAEINKMMGSQQAQLDAAPPAVVQSMIFPYLAGAEFLTALRIEGIDNWRDIAFIEPPQSTSQILHPRLYIEERHQPVKIPALRGLPEGSSWKEVFRNNVGEWTVRLFLTPERAFPRITALSTELLVTHPAAVAGAEGWHGDQWVLIQNEETNAHAAAWRIAFRRSEDVQEFFTALTAKIATIPGSGINRDGNAYVYTLRNPQRIMKLERGQQEVILLIARDQDGIDAAATLVPR